MLKISLLLCGLLLLFAGAYSLPEEGFPYSRRHTARIGPFEASARTRERITIPAPAGWGMVAVGAGLLLAGAYAKKR
mgnify:CR=1 FL=1|jgi:hypothetical protein